MSFPLALLFQEIDLMSEATLRVSLKDTLELSETQQRLIEKQKDLIRRLDQERTTLIRENRKGAEQIKRLQLLMADLAFDTVPKK